MCAVVNGEEALTQKVRPHWGETKSIRHWRNVPLRPCLMEMDSSSTAYTFVESWGKNLYARLRHCLIGLGTGGEPSKGISGQIWSIISCVLNFCTPAGQAYVLITARHQSVRWVWWFIVIIQVCAVLVSEPVSIIDADSTWRTHLLCCLWLDTLVNFRRPVSQFPVTWFVFVARLCPVCA